MMVTNEMKGRLQGWYTAEDSVDDAERRGSVLQAKTRRRQDPGGERSWKR